MIGIYKIENKINGNVYIGQSCNLQARMAEHKCPGKFDNPNKASYNYPLYRAIRKYGIENFSFTIIEQCELEALDEREKYWIKYYDSYNNGYNATLGGKTGANYEEFPVYKYDIYGNFLEEYNNLYTAAEKNNIKPSALQEVLADNPRHKTAGGYQWKKYKQEKILSKFKYVQVTCYSLQNEKIATYNSFQEASFYSKDNVREIRNCCEHKLKSTMKYQWFYTDEIIDKQLEPNFNRGKGVNQYVYNFNLINHYPSIKRAQEITGICGSMISEVCHIEKERRHHTAGGYIWAYDTVPVEKLVQLYDKYEEYLIEQYDLNNHYINTYSSGAQAGEQVFHNSENRKGIIACCKNKKPNYGGYIWKYVKKFQKK